MKFTFISEDDTYSEWHDTTPLTKRTVEFSAELLDDVLKEFQMFLSGCGYHFKGDLQFINEDNFKCKDSVNTSTITSVKPDCSAMDCDLTDQYY
jgi:hypothetical protein